VDTDSENNSEQSSTTSNPPATDNNTTNSLEEIPEVETLQERTAQTINDNSQQPSPQE
jgi:hypothetical protein